MPKGNWGHHGYPHPAEEHWIFPELERTPDLSRGAIRFASEAMLAEIAGEKIPGEIRMRVFSIIEIMARG